MPDSQAIIVPRIQIPASGVGEATCVVGSRPTEGSVADPHPPVIIQLRLFTDLAEEPILLETEPDAALLLASELLRVYHAGFGGGDVPGG